MATFTQKNKDCRFVYLGCLQFGALRNNGEVNAKSTTNGMCV